MLETRTVSGTIHKATGDVWPFAEVTFKLRQNAGAGGIVVPQFPEVITADEDGHFECELYTVTDSFLPYRCTLPNGRGFKFDLPPGEEITLDVLQDLGPLEDEDSVSAALINAITLSLVWSNITGKPSTFPPSTHTHSSLETSITNLGQAVVDIEDAVEDLDTEKQDVSEKDQPDGYAGLDAEGIISATQSGIDNTQKELRAQKRWAANVNSLLLRDGNFIRINRDDPYNIFALDNTDTNAYWLGSIHEENDVDPIDGTEFIVVNHLQPIELRRQQSGNQGSQLYWYMNRDLFVWPTGTAVHFRFNEGEGFWVATPLFTISELTSAINESGNVTIDDTNYQNYQGTMRHVNAETNYYVSQSVPDGFVMHVVSETTDDITFISSGDPFLNRQGHSKVAGQYGVVSIMKLNGWLWLYGDTKA